MCVFLWILCGLMGCLFVCLVAEMLSLNLQMRLRPAFSNAVREKCGLIPMKASEISMANPVSCIASDWISFCFFVFLLEFVMSVVDAC